MSNNLLTRWGNELTGSLNKCARRFPTATFFIAALTCWFIYLTHKDGLDDLRLTYAITYYFAVGIPLSIMLQLWSEEIKNKQRHFTIQATGQMLLLADAIFLYSVETVTLAITVAHTAIVMAIIIATFLISFYRERNDLSCWNFSWRTIVAYIKAQITGILFTGGIELLIFSISILFDTNISDEIYIDVAIIFSIGFTCLFFIGMLPAGNAKHDTLPRTNTFLNIMVSYVFIPLVACYIIVLYAYTARIIMLWELPDGYVSLLVTALMAGCIIIEAGLYPFRQFPVKKQSHELIARWLPMLILPLLLLMTIGIVRRINDYGITYMRLYLITFNLWCYGVCIILYLTRARRIMWIPASFAIVLLITSIIPKFNFANISLETIQGEIEETMRQTCTDTPPLSEEQYDNWINNTLPEKEAQLINDKLIYLSETYDTADYNHLVADSIYFYYYKIYYGAGADTVVADVEGYYAFYASLGNGFDIPDGVTRITEVQLYGYNSDSQLVFHRNGQLPVGLNASDTIYIDFPTLKMLNSDYAITPYDKLPQNRDDFKFVLTELNGSAGDNDSVNITEISGYLFNLNNIHKHNE